ncbi:MAG TPA: 3-oxoacyl-[acyl-carrier-protein] synthase III C-terminal domain-containing protein, partial [Chthoniobacterales bacterium]|nr:3-oxoacyl-[acyl-carrier-protein] synthase III C-terminal domain-containing protein [Chthoniobacterales bacterium]
MNRTDMTSNSEALGLRSVAAVLPPATANLEELKKANLLVSETKTLAELGFEKLHVCDKAHDPEWLALEAASQAIAKAGLEPGEVDILIWASALSDTHIRLSDKSPDATGNLLGLFNYRASWLQEELRLDAARVMGIAQQGCAGMFSALSTGQAFLRADPSIRNVVCVGVDALPEGSPREILYNLISDAGCAVVLSRENLRCHWREFHQVSKGYYWNIAEKQKEIIASYFPTSRAVIRELLAKAGLTPDDIRWILPTGISPGSWDILASITGLKSERIFRGRQPFGHTIAADNLLHLETLLAAGDAQAGDLMLLFTYGFGSTWSGLV